jgi:hypothetical protein
MIKLGKDCDMTMNQIVSLKQSLADMKQHKRWKGENLDWDNPDPFGKHYFIPVKDNKGRLMHYRMANEEQLKNRHM